MPGLENLTLPVASLICGVVLFVIAVAAEMKWIRVDTWARYPLGLLGIVLVAVAILTYYFPMGAKSSASAAVVPPLQSDSSPQGADSDSAEPESTARATITQSPGSGVDSSTERMESTEESAATSEPTPQVTNTPLVLIPQLDSGTHLICWHTTCDPDSWGANGCEASYDLLIAYPEGAARNGVNLGDVELNREWITDASSPFYFGDIANDSLRMCSFNGTWHEQNEMKWSAASYLQLQDGRIELCEDEYPCNDRAWFISLDIPSISPPQRVQELMRSPTSNTIELLGWVAEP